MRFHGVVFADIASSGVFLSSNRIQMVRIDAVSNTAKMIELESVGDRANVMLIRDTVSPANGAVQLEAAVAVVSLGV